MRPADPSGLEYNTLPRRFLNEPHHEANDISAEYLANRSECLGRVIQALKKLRNSGGAYRRAEEKSLGFVATIVPHAQELLACLDPSAVTRLPSEGDNLFR